MPTGPWNRAGGRTENGTYNIGVGGVFPPRYARPFFLTGLLSGCSLVIGHHRWLPQPGGWLAWPQFLPAPTPVTALGPCVVLFGHGWPFQDRRLCAIHQWTPARLRGLRLDSRWSRFFRFRASRH